MVMRGSGNRCGEASMEDALQGVRVPVQGEEVNLTQEDGRGQGGEAARQASCSQGRKHFKKGGL